MDEVSRTNKVNTQSRSVVICSVPSRGCASNERNKSACKESPQSVSPLRRLSRHVGRPIRNRAQHRVSQTLSISSDNTNRVCPSDPEQLRFRTTITPFIPASATSTSRRRPVPLVSTCRCRLANLSQHTPGLTRRNHTRPRQQARSNHCRTYIAATLDCKQVTWRRAIATASSSG